MISAPTYFERSETNPSVALRQLPRGTKIYSITILNLPINKTNLPKAYIRQVGCLYSPSVGEFDFLISEVHINLVDDILPSYIAAEIFETDVPYFLFCRWVVTETAPGDMRSYQNIRHFPQR